jgi:protocatechuate 3,4-dioxygenase alpha subunit
VVPDGLFEIWQANSHGRYNHPDDRRNLPLDAEFEGYGRASTFTDGCAHFSTVKPGRVPWPAGGMQAPHINLSIFARGLLNRVATRLYFDGEPANAEDPVLKMIDPARRPTLLAKKDAKGAWRLPIRLGGPSETVFFDI